MNLSFFERPEKISEAVGMRLRLELQGAPLLLLGVWPGRAEEVIWVQDLLGKLKEKELHYDVVVVQEDLPGFENFPANEKISFRDELSRFAAGAKDLLTQGRRVVVIAPSVFTTQLLSGNPADRLKTEFGLDPVSLSAAPFPHLREEEKGFEVACITGATDPSGTGPFGCAVLHKARSMYRKKKQADRFAASLDQVGLKDYLLLMTAPKTASLPAL